MAFLNGLLTSGFFTQSVNLTEAQAKREDDLLLLLQTMLLLDNRHEGREYKNISAATCLAYAESIRNTYNGDKRDMLQALVEYLDEAFPVKMKYLRKNNAIIVGVCAKAAQEQGADPNAFKAFICEFSNNIYPAIISTGGFSGRLPTGYAPADSTVSVSSPGTAVIYFPCRQRFPSFIPAASVRSMQHGTSIL